jgi:hypothetical protein
MLESQVNSEGTSTINATNTIENVKLKNNINTKKIEKKESEIELSFASFYYSLKVSKGKGKL